MLSIQAVRGVRRLRALALFLAQARRNVFVSGGGGYKFVRTLYNPVVKVVYLKF